MVHAGDLTSPEMALMFEGFDMRIVYGNCDCDHIGIVKSCKSVGFTPASRSCEFELDGKRFFLIHGDDSQRYIEAVESRRYSYIITGHTHMYEVKRKHNTIVINPGAVTRDNQSGSEKTCAVLDIETGDVEKIVIS